jgi:asparagine synthase (glutamine-hydrolysing)
VCATAAGIAKAAGNSGAQRAFTISWRPLFDDPEPEFAQLTARHLGLSHEILQENSILPNESGAASSPEPSSEFFLDRDHRLRQIISKHARVVISGDGGDDILSGQSWPYLQYLWARGEWTEIARSFGGYLISHGRFPTLRGGFRSKLRRFAGAKDKPPELPVWLNAGFADRCRLQSEVNLPERPRLEEHPLHPAAYRALHGGYWASVHETEDAGCTGVLLETRAPLLDLRILRFLLRLPPVPWCINKELCRRTMEGSLPRQVLVRRKAPLLEDPLELCWSRGVWRPHPENNPPKMVHEFVKWNSWLATFKDVKGYLPYEYLYTLSFSLWLKAVEKEGPVQ